MKKFITGFLLILSVFLVSCESSTSDDEKEGTIYFSCDVDFEHDLSTIYDSNPGSTFSMGESGDDFEINLKDVYVTITNSTDTTITSNGTNVYKSNAQRIGNTLYVNILNSGNNAFQLTLDGDQITTSSFEKDNDTFYNEFTDVQGTLDYVNKTLKWSYHLVSTYR